ncbi:MAG: helix-turn-helix domain-containing protein [Lawsonibacter sp.]|nr:helix-turn-helix domain-containing protein [Lawsonibacter sp.]
MYGIIESLCLKNKMTVGKMCSDLGISRGTMGDLKAGRTKKLSADNMAKIAARFSVSTDYLLTGEETEKAPALTEKDERDVARDVERIMGNLENSGELMFDGVPMSPEAKAAMAAAMRIGLEEAKRRNKETYTPKKYRKG